MRKTKESPMPIEERSAIPIPGVMAEFSIGRAAAEELVRKAGARFTIGRRVLCNRKKLLEYMDSVSTH